MIFCEVDIIPILTKYILNTSKIVQLKAPRGKLFAINGIAATTINNGSNRFIMFDRAFEEAPDAISITTYADSIIFAIEADIAQSLSLPLKTSHKTKYISFAPGDAAQAASVLFIVDYEIVTGSKAELIWEWISKRR